MLNYQRVSVFPQKETLRFLDISLTDKITGTWVFPEMRDPQVTMIV